MRRCGPPQVRVAAGCLGTATPEAAAAVTANWHSYHLLLVPPRSTLDPVLRGEVHGLDWKAIAVFATASLYFFATPGALCTCGDPPLPCLQHVDGCVPRQQRRSPHRLTTAPPPTQEHTQQPCNRGSSSSTLAKRLSLISSAIDQSFPYLPCPLPCPPGVLPGAIDYYLSAPLQRKRSRPIAKVGAGTGHTHPQAGRLSVQEAREWQPAPAHTVRARPMRRFC